VRFRNALVTLVVPALLVTGATFAAVEISIPDEKQDDLDLYFPREPGTTWTYKVTTDGEDSGLKTSQVIEKGPLFAQELGSGLGDDPLVQAVTLEHRWEDLFGRPFRDAAYITRRGDSLVSVGDRTHGDDLQLTEPPAIILKLPLKIGTSWTFEGTERGLELEAETEIVSRGPQTVGNMDFDDCFVTETVSNWVDGNGQQQSVTIETSLCRGVGIVRTVEDSRSLDSRLEQELVSFVAPGDRIAAGTAPEPTDPSLGQDPLRSSARADETGSLDPDRLSWSFTDQDYSDFPMVTAGDVVVVSNSLGWISAWDRTTGDELWSLRVSPPLVAAPAIARGTVFLSDADKSLMAVDAMTGATLWWEQLPDIATVPAVAAGDVVVATAQDGTARAFDILSGDQQWSASLPDFPSYPGHPAGNAVVYPVNDELIALSAADGSELWTAGFDDLVNAPIATDGEIAVVGDEASAVTAIDLTDGSELWERVLTGYRLVYSAPALGSNEVIFVTEGSGGEDLITAVSRDEGEVLWEMDLPADVKQPPLIVGDETAVITDDAELLQLSLDDGSISARSALRSLTGQTGGSVPQPPVIAGNDLIVAVRGGLDYEVTTYHGFDLSGEVAAAPRLEAKLAPSAESPRGGIVPRGDSLLVGTFSAGILALTPGALPETLIPLDEPPLSVVGSTLGLLVGGAEGVTSFDADDGSKVWEAPVPPASGSRPTAASDLIAIVTDGGAAALDPASGELLWDRQLAGVGVQPPTVYDGDVFVVKGGLQRLDGRSGETEWLDPGMEGFNPVAFAGGVGLVHAYDLPNNEVGLFAFDPTDGSILWKRPNIGISLLAGIGAGDGIFVASDDRGLVTAYDASSGDELWSVQLRTPIDGTPFVSEGIVGIVEKGRSENFRATAYRVRYHDLTTGRFLGSVEPLGSSFTLGVTNAGNGNLFVPESRGILSLRMVR
jgi:outer membrane protein assembly factor BamB